MNLSNENVIHVKKNGIEYLQFRRLLEYQDILTHAYTLGLDVNFRTATIDKRPIPEKEYNKAINDYKNICEALDTSYIDIVKTNQEHTNNVEIVKNKINKNTPDINLKQYWNTDGLITNKKGIMLSSTNADCILLLFFDPVKKVIANIHSGWKGTLQRISVVAVSKMINEYGCNPKDIICCITPSIRQCHFEVDENVKNLFYNEFHELEGTEKIIKNNPGTKKWNIDTVLINKLILEKQGLRKENIIDSGICSVCNSSLIHSYRVEKEGYSLETALIELK